MHVGAGSFRSHGHRAVTQQLVGPVDPVGLQLTTNQHSGESAAIDNQIAGHGWLILNVDGNDVSAFVSLSAGHITHAMARPIVDRNRLQKRGKLAGIQMKRVI